MDGLVETCLLRRGGSGGLGLVVPGGGPAVDAAAVLVGPDCGLHFEGDWDVEVASPEQLLVLVEAVHVLGVLAVRFYELAVRAVELLIGPVGLVAALAVLVNGHLVFVGAVEDPKWGSGYLLR